MKLIVLLATLLISISDAFRLRLHPVRPYFRRSVVMQDASAKYTVGIVGATGAVGEEILKVMENRHFPASSIKLFASERSAGKTIESSEFGQLTMDAFSFEAATQCDVCLLAVDGDFSKVRVS